MTAPLPSAGGPILVAVDFSADSELALVWAARQAELEGAALIVLHVVHDPAASPGFYRKPDENWLRPMVDVAKDMMAEFLKSANSEHPDLPALASARADLVSGPVACADALRYPRDGHGRGFSDDGENRVNSSTIGAPGASYPTRKALPKPC